MKSLFTSSRHARQHALRPLCWLLCTSVLTSIAAVPATHGEYAHAGTSILEFQRQLDTMFSDAPVANNIGAADILNLQHTLTETIHPDEGREEDRPRPQDDAILLIPQRFFLISFVRRIIPAPRDTAPAPCRPLTRRPLRPPGTRMLYQFHLLSNAPPVVTAVPQNTLTFRLV